MKHTKKLTLCAAFAALCCVCTMFSIPITANGYIHPGDSIVLLSAYLLGPLAGGAAAGIGSACADLLLGYAYYAPATFIIKLLDAFIAGAVFRLLSKKQRTPSVTLSIAGMLGSAVMVLGYFLYSFLFLGDGFSAAFSAIPANILQAVTGIALSVLLYELLCSHKAIKRFFDI